MSGDIRERDPFGCAVGGNILQFYARILFRGFPGALGYLPVRSRRQMQDCIGRLSRRTQLRSTVFDRIIDIRAVDLLQILILFLDGERDSMCANFTGFQVRTQRDVLVINLRIIALDHGKARHRFAEDRLDLPAFPILHFPIRLGDFSHRIMSKRRGNQVFIYAWHMLLGHFGQDAGECPVNIPVGA
ncbi:hypothetical protein D3C74_309560 [compost metagenome]